VTTYQADAGDMRMVLAGDTMLTRALSPFSEPGYLALRDLIRGADLAFANLETNVREIGEGFPVVTQGTPMTTTPDLLDELKWLGFGLVAAANNHVGDYGPEGVAATARHLRAARIAFAGCGINMAAARAPGYKDTPAGRVGLVAATSRYKSGDRAGEQRADIAGRPGINPLAYSFVYSIADKDFDVLERLSKELGLAKEMERKRAQFYSENEAPKESADAIEFFDQKVRRGKTSTVHTVVNKRDAEANLRWIREAKRQSDWVIFSFHNHEFGKAGRLTAHTNIDLEEPADFVPEFAKAAIDAGADIVAGHGPHLTLGLEIYRGKPIFYSLGNFVLQNDTVRNVPSDSYDRFDLGHDATPADFFDERTGNETRGFPAHKEFWETFVAEVEFTGRNLSSLRLHPVVLGFGKSRAQRGRPMLAEGPAAADILARLARLSKPYGTEIRVTGNTGEVVLDRAIADAAAAGVRAR
jgi:poly-gamma-glutamate capsule biosynthesis protein CapA/YwtB (metallophosphatase superfamily)